MLIIQLISKMVKVGGTLIITFPFDVAIGVSLGDAKNAVDAVRTGPLQRWVVGREKMWTVLLLLLLMLQVRRYWRYRRAVRYHRRRLRYGAHRAAVGAAVVAAVVTHRFRLLRRFVPHNSVQLQQHRFKKKSPKSFNLPGIWIIIQSLDLIDIIPSWDLILNIGLS